MWPTDRLKRYSVACCVSSNMNEMNSILSHNILLSVDHLLKRQKIKILFFFCTFAESFSLIGTVFGVLGSLSLSLYSIYMKKVLPKVDQDVILLGYYINFYACCLFLPIMYLNEEFSEIYHYQYLWELWFWGALSVGGVCGFAIGFVTVLQIKVTSPLTHNISGTAKACAQTVIATQWFNETKSFLWWSSNAVVLLGSALYTRVRQVEMEEKYKKQALERQSV